MESTRSLLATTRVDKKDIAGVSISGHGIGVVPVNQKGELLRERTLLWSDSRAIEQARAYFRKVDPDHWYATTGAALRAENYVLFKIMWHRDHEPDLYNATWKFLGTKDYINFLLTGRMISDFTDASFSGINDLLKWQYSEELCRPAGIPLEKYPDLYPSTHVVGELLPGPAQELGLSPGTPIVCGGYGGSCTALGAGNFKEGRLDPYQILEQQAMQSPVGANGLIFNPSLMGGATIHPSPNIKGAFIGLGLQHTKADLLRSVLEGVATDLRLALQAFRSMGVEAREIRMVGGGSKSPLWRQIFADVYDARIVLTGIGREAAALGAAALAGVGTGVWKDFSIIDTIAQTVHVTEPDADSRGAYGRIIPRFAFIMERLLEIGDWSAQA